jgi:hypothetical protein
MKGLWRSIGVEQLCDRMVTFDTSLDVVHEILQCNDEEKTRFHACSGVGGCTEIKNAEKVR